MASEESKRGIPLYVDETRRGVIDSTDEDLASPNWHPSNAVAVKLWHCLEAFRDVDLVLEEAARQKNSTKKKRRLKQFSVHLYSLASAVVQLCNHIVGDKSNHAHMPSDTTKEVAQIKREFLELVPLDWKGDLATLRNKLGAHVDAKVLPREAQELMLRSSVSDMGRWLHVCIHLLLDLTKLDVYSWTCERHKDAVRLMTNEPFLVTFGLVDGKPKQILAVHISKRSPKEAVIDVARGVVKNSQWMFGPEERRIRRLVIDNDKHWNTFAQARAIWKDQATE